MQTQSSSIGNSSTLANASLAEDLLLDKLLQANTLEQSGQVEQAKAIYKELIAIDATGTYGMSALKALEALGGEVADPLADQLTPAGGSAATQSAATNGAAVVTTGLGQKTARSAKTTAPAKAGIPVVGWLTRRWNNLSLTTKLTLLLVTGAVVPVLIATQGLVTVTQNRVQQDFNEKLRSNANSWEADYVVWVRDESRTESENLGRLVQISNIDLSDAREVANRQRFLQAIVRDATSTNDRIRPEMTKSFRILTTARGVSVVQSVKIHTQAKAGVYPAIAPAARTISPDEFRAVDGSQEIDLSRLPIVQESLKLGQPLRGIEIVPAQIVAALGLTDQAAIVPRPPVASPSAAQQPAPPGTYNLDNNQAALVSMAVYPIRIGDKLVGAAIVGTVLNKNHALLDYFQQLFNVPSVSIYAYNLRVNATLDAGDGTRAIGVAVPADISNAILEQGQEELFQVDTINGVRYRTIYRPLYDFRKESNPAQAKPVGMIAIARPQTDLDRLLLEQQGVGLLIAAAALLVITILAIPLARLFTVPLRSLVQFAQEVGQGKATTRLSMVERADEIGILSREMNQMVDNIESNIAAVRRQENFRRQEAEHQRQEREKIQRGVVNLLLEIQGAQQGDLTVNAPVTEGSIGSIADAFNATIRSLRELVLQVKDVANQVNELAVGSAPSMQNLSEEATIQAQELQRALTTVTQIADSIRGVATTAQGAAEIAQEGAKAAQQGEQVIDMTVQSIDGVSHAVAQTASKVDRLTESFQQISQILTTISSISERTNLLAYNASIEASRAGEHGQGFRVVAEEVRRLAQRITEATHSIEQIVEVIQQETSEVRQAMETGQSEVVVGTEMVNKTRLTLKQLAAIGQKIDAYLQTISHSTSSQVADSQEVNQVMSQVVFITQKTAGQAQDVAKSLRDLVTVAKSLQDSVAQFKLE